MKKILKNGFGKIYLEIELDDIHPWVYANWFGHPTPRNVRAGVLAYTEVLKGVEYGSMLIDTRHMVGTWEHSLEWMLNIWAPKAAEAGLTYYALVSNPDTLAEATATDFYDQLTFFESKIFQELDEAKEWLIACNNR